MSFLIYDLLKNLILTYQFKVTSAYFSLNTYRLLPLDVLHLECIKDTAIFNILI